MKLQWQVVLREDTSNAFVGAELGSLMDWLVLIQR